MSVEWLPEEGMSMVSIIDGTNFFGAMIFGPKINKFFVTRSSRLGIRSKLRNSLLCCRGNITEK